jgi:polyisoprenoid-binding protein YceI
MEVGDMKGSLRSAAWLLMLLIALAGPKGVRADEPFVHGASQMIDPQKVHVRFKVRVFGLISIAGRFERLLGVFLSNADGEPARVRMQIEAASLTTDDAWRDEYLRGPAFFATDRYPHITFSGSCVSRSENGVGRVVGELSVRGRSRRIALAFEPAAPAGESGPGVYRAKTVIRRSDFGLDAMQHLVSDKVEVIVAMQAASAE